MENVRIFCIVLVYICWTFAYIVVGSKTNSAFFSKAHFIYGEHIATSNGVPSVFACLLTCDDTCGYVQYTDNDTCTLYADAALHTEPTNGAGQIKGYRKVFPRVSRYIAVRNDSLQPITYDQAQSVCENVGSGLATIRNQSDFDALHEVANKSGHSLLKVPEDRAFWISGKRSTGIWRWYTGEVIPNQWFWYPGQPDHPDDPACARVNVETETLNILDWDCIGFLFKLLCE